MKKETTYRDSGVDIDLGDRCSKIMYEAARQTWDNRKGRRGEVRTTLDDFSGLRYVDISGLANVAMNLNLDGVGTKVEIAERVSAWTGDFSCHRAIAHDLFAMVCDDAAIRGAEPILVGSILDVNRLHVELVRNLAVGMVEAATQARVAVVNGETAELGDRISGYGEFHYNWGAVALWMADTDHLVTGRDVRPGDAIVSLQEHGFRSNGLSLFRRVMVDQYGQQWHEKGIDGRNIARLALTPSTIYTSFIIDLIAGDEPHSGARIKAMAHITGGGIPGKLGRALRPSGFGADINDLFDPCELMLHCQEVGQVTDEEAYRTWNMGNGLMLVTSEPDRIIQAAHQKSLGARVAGQITREPDIRIRSKGVFADRSAEPVFQIS